MGAGRTRKWGVALGWLVSARVAAAPAGDIPETLADCEALIGTSARLGEAASCMYAYARRGSDYEGAEARLRRYATDEPDNPWPKLKLASVLVDQGKPGAIELYREGIARLGPDEKDNEAESRLNLAGALRWAGEDEAALAELGAAKRAAEASGVAPLRQVVTLELARHLLFSSGNLTRVGELLDEVGDLPAPMYQARVNLLHTRSVWLSRLGEIDASTAVLRELTTLASDNGDDYLYAATLLKIADAEDDQAELRLQPSRSQHETRLQQARAAADKAGHAYVHADVYCRLSDLRADDAVDHARRCVELSTRAGDKRQLANARVTLATALRRADQWDAYEREIAGLQEWAADAEVGSKLIVERIDAAWARAPRPEAITVSLAALEELERTVDEDDPERLAQRRAALRASHDLVVGRLLDVQAPGDDDVRTALQIAERQRNDDILLGHERPTGATVDLDALRTRLAPGHVVIAYVLANDVDYKSGAFLGGAWAWTITADAVTVRRLPERRRLAAQVGAFVGSLRGDDPLWAETADAMRQSLFGDEVPAATRVTVVPDRELFELPFAVLLPDAAVDQVTSLRAIVQRPPQDLREVDALALTAYADPAREGVAVDGLPLRPLPNARDEAAAVARTFGERSEVVLGEQATESAIKASLSQSGILHVAAHAVVDSAQPERSALVMARSTTDDGTLTIAELERVTLRRDLVVLSACASSAGPLAAGLGLHGLGQMLIHRGARTVVGTRWPIRDDFAQAMFETFYTELSHGAATAEALRRAQRAAQADGLPASAWASLVVLGDGDMRAREPARARDPRPRLGGAIALGGLLLAGVILGTTRRR